MPRNDGVPGQAAGIGITGLAGVDLRPSRMLVAGAVLLVFALLSAGAGAAEPPGGSAATGLSGPLAWLLAGCVALLVGAAFWIGRLTCPAEAGPLPAAVDDAMAGKLNEDTLRVLAESGGSTESDILRFLVRELARALDRQCAMIARVGEDDTGTSRTVAVWNNGAFAPNFTYTLAGTPCANVAEACTCCYPRDVQALFPADQLAVDMNAESYWGTPLRDSVGKVMGILAVVDNRPMEENPETLSLLKSFAVRAAAELERRTLEEKYGVLFREMLDGMAVHEVVTGPDGRPADFRFVDVNPAFERLFGRPASAVVGRTVQEVMPGAEPYVIGACASVVMTGQPARYERFCRELGMHFAVVAFRPQKGHLAVLFRDVTEQRRAEERVRHAETLEAVGQVTGGVAHVFNNLLQVMQGNLDLARPHIEGGTPAGDFVDRAIFAGRRGARLIQQLLSYSRQQALWPTTVGPNRLVEDALPAIRDAVGGAVRIETALEGGLPDVAVDPRNFRTALVNLATNARAAMPGGGVLTVRTGRTEIEGDIALVDGMLPAGTYIEIGIVDTGFGMPPEVLERAFEPFFTTRETSDGSGLGLSMVFGFARQSGGHVTLESALGQGTTVRLLLPVVAAGRPSAGAARGQAEFAES